MITDIPRRFAHNDLLLGGLLTFGLVLWGAFGSSGLAPWLGAVPASLLSGGSVVCAVAAGFGMITALRQTERARQQAALLLQVSDMLQMAATREDAAQVLRAGATRLLGGLNGVFYAAGPLGDRVVLLSSWGRGKVPTRIDRVQCWGLKRQRLHMNERRPGALRCTHMGGGEVTLELPLVEQGEVHGLLVLSPAAGGVRALRRQQELAVQLAGALARAMSAIALRDRLRELALRDGLTGLYNRRFLEELRERLAREAVRRKSSLAAIMLDLDHFKRINDEHGHAAGDAVLRAVASKLGGLLRCTDLFCRYGGEELVVLLPDCSLSDAVERAERLRLRVSELAGELDIPMVTASFGVAAIPETSASAAALLGAADAALYQAKQAGRNQVVAAPTRPAAQTISLLDLGTGR